MKLRWGLSVPVWLAAMPLLVAGQGPLKLGVELDDAAIAAGDRLGVHIQLLDGANRRAPAPKAMRVLLQARQSSGKVDPLRPVDFAAGQSSAETVVQPPGTGLVYVWAKHPELLPGGAYVRVRPTPASQAAARSQQQEQQTMREQKSAGPPPPPPPPVMASPGSAVQLTLRYSPDRQFLADGKDAASIEAFLLSGDDTAPADIRLNVFDSSGTLQPTPMRIRRGEFSGRSAITSSQPGVVTVEYLGSAPPAGFEGDRKLSIRFMPAITRLQLDASPPAITLLDTADLVVRLADEGGRPLAADAPRKVSFTIESGQGGLQQKEVTIPAGEFQARTAFQPEWPGAVRLSASTANLMTVTVPIQVSVPLALLLCSAAGGAAGGMLSGRKRRKPNRWRPLIGLITGFLLYWFCIFLGLAAVARSVALNPFSALALSALGGWLQTEVFTAVWSAVRPKARA